MKIISLWLIILAGLTPFAIGAMLTQEQESATTADTDSLYQTISSLDSAVFDAFNRCLDPEQLDKHRHFFAKDVEFYHDTGGVTWTRAAMIANTEKYVCGKFRRELIPGSLTVYPIKDFGAIASGAHRFCHFELTKIQEPCQGMAQFTTIWQKKANRWQITRVLSFGHQATP